MAHHEDRQSRVIRSLEKGNQMVFLSKAMLL